MMTELSISMRTDTAGKYSFQLKMHSKDIKNFQPTAVLELISKK